MSPTVLRQDGWQFIIHTDDHIPAHVHIRRGHTEVARIKLDPVELWDSKGLNIREITDILSIAEANQALLLTEWDKFHPKR